ncbi:MAG: S24 family peptidase [Burkholderiaceae bacterium]|nr:S24 family peptidase [Burkholderiaceae bacterium]
MPGSARDRPLHRVLEAHRVIPIAPAGERRDGSGTATASEGAQVDERTDACASGESFALMVLGDSMLPEFAEGEIIVVEPEGLATDGSFVLAWSNDEWIFRQLVRVAQGWKLSPLNPRHPDIELADLSAVRGVIIQKSTPGRRRQSKRYVE